MNSPSGQSRGGTPIGERALQSARRTQVRWIRTRVDRRSAFLFFFLTFVAQSTDREGTGDHRRHSLAKIGAESEKILPLDDDSGAGCIARTRLLALNSSLPGLTRQSMRRCRTHYRSLVVSEIQHGPPGQARW